MTQLSGALTLFAMEAGERELHAGDEGGGAERENEHTRPGALGESGRRVVRALPRDRGEGPHQGSLGDHETRLTCLSWVPSAGLGGG